jgi:formylglycine-generating enzyme required for sulfatase activity
VTIKPFDMAKTPVTNKQYRACVAARGCTPAHVGRCFIYAGSWAWGRLPDRFQGDDQPAVCVDWEQAEMFSEWVGGRLPSEAEWEFAARGAAGDWKYPWGDREPTCERALVRGCGNGASAPVCSTPAGNTPQGLCDMAGNVWEWVRDSYHASYEGAPLDGSFWDVASSSHVARGGSMYDDGEKARCAYRNGLLSGAYYHVGFRPVR